MFLQLQKITNVATPDFLWAWHLYEEAFPTEERRTQAQQEQLLLNLHYQFLVITSDTHLVGLAGIWELDGFNFLEHFAVSLVLRGKGLGQRVLDLLASEFPGSWVLEVEPPLTEIAQRRINFYKRAGFHLNPFSYQQPPYSPDKPWVPLQLMSFPYPLPERNFSIVAKAFHKTVYGV